MTKAAKALRLFAQDFTLLTSHTTLISCPDIFVSSDVFAAFLKLHNEIFAF